jgi:hypothetical protein
LAGMTCETIRNGETSSGTGSSFCYNVIDNTPLWDRDRTGLTRRSRWCSQLSRMFPLRSSEAACWHKPLFKKAAASRAGSPRRWFAPVGIAIGGIKDSPPRLDTMKDLELSAVRGCSDVPCFDAVCATLFVTLRTGASTGRRPTPSRGHDPAVHGQGGRRGSAGRRAADPVRVSRRRLPAPEGWSSRGTAFPVRSTSRPSVHPLRGCRYSIAGAAGAGGRELPDDPRLACRKKYASVESTDR